MQRSPKTTAAPRRVTKTVRLRVPGHRTTDREGLVGVSVAASTWQLLVAYRMSFYGRRAFSVGYPTTWYVHLTHWRRQLWGTGARASSTSNCLIFQVTSEPHKV